MVIYDLDLVPAAADFGKQVRSVRERLGWSQGKLAETSGLPRTFASSVVRGEQHVALWNTLKLARALKVGSGELLSGLQP